MSRRWGLFFFILDARGIYYTTAWREGYFGIIFNWLFLRLFLMRWLRFFVVVFCDIYWFAWNNRCYLSKKYELVINLNLYVNWCELGIELYVN